MASFNGKDSHSKTNSIRELRDRVKVYIDQGKEKKRKLKERTDKLTAALKQAIDELSNVSSEYRDLLDDQNEILESVHGELSKYKGEDVVVDKKETVSPTQVEGSESPGTSRSTALSPPSQPQNETIQMQKTDLCALDVQKVVYSKRRKKKNQLTLRSSGSSASPYLPRHDVEISDEEAAPQVSMEYVQVQIIDEYQDGHNRKQFSCPYQLVNGPKNELIISDRDHHQLVVFDEKLQSSFVYGKKGFGEGTFCFPTGLTVDATESCLFVVDRDNNNIQKFKITYPDANKFPCQFEYVEKYGSKGGELGELNCPCGLAFSKKESRLFVCDQQNHRIQIFTNEGTPTHTFGKRGDGKGEFNEPHSIAINNNEDKLFVSDHGNNRVQVFTPKGEFIQRIVDNTNAPNWPQLQYPRGIHCTYDGRVLVSSTHTNCILEFEEDGTYKSTIEGIHQPGGIILHHTGGVIVTCTDTKKIIVLTEVRKQS